MPDIRSFLVAAGVVVVIVVLVWFAVGTIGNIRKGNRVLEWLQEGLPTLGRRTKLRWLGSSAVELTIDEARAPLRAAAVVVVLEPRDVGITWAWGRSRGRRDFLILRGELPHAPRFELEAGDVRGWTGRDALKRPRPGSWTETTWGGPELVVAHTRGADQSRVRRHWERLDAASAGMWRLSVRREPPHLEVHAVLPDTATVSSEPLIRDFARLAADL